MKKHNNMLFYTLGIDMFVSNKTKPQKIMQIDNTFIKKMKCEEPSQSFHLNDIHLKSPITIQHAKVVQEINQTNKNNPEEAALKRASDEFFFQSQVVKTINEPLHNGKNNKKEDEDELQFVLEL